MSHLEGTNTSSVTTSERDFLPTAAIETLRLRARLLSRIRQFFDSSGYWEVETPILSHEIVVDAFLEPFMTHWLAESGGGGRSRGDEQKSELFLQTSPELAMKRLLAAGAKAIYQITHAMRNGELGRYHNPEFTMIEWYRVGDTHQEQMVFVERLVLEIDQAIQPTPEANAACERDFSEDGGARLTKGFERVTYDAAFQRFTGTKILRLSAPELADVARRHSIAVPPGLQSDDRDAWLNLLLIELVEPNLGHDKPVFLYDYPASQAALARVRGDSPAVAERFELYIRGIEICNGYRELTDPNELRRRIEKQASIRNREGHRDLPPTSRLIAAMEAGLPECAGVALGFDRLMMVLIGAASIREVMAFPFDRA